MSADERTTLSGDAEHVYITDATGRILSTHDDLDAARAAMRCPCRGTRRLSRAVIDGGDGWVSCPWCAALPITPSVPPYGGDKP